MKPILIFAGTTEGRRMAELLVQSQIPCMACVATEYGTQMLQEQEGLEILQGRLEEKDMEALFAQNEFLAVVDATHPFATEVSQNIKESSGKKQIPYLRLKRSIEDTEQALFSENAGIRFFADSQECARALEETEGNIFLTTGSKELSVFCENPSVKERLLVRVLPGVESIKKCKEQGISGKQILALQGPFSEDFNRACLKEYEIEHLVTKETGAAGGYPQKVGAAIKEGVALYIIGNPEKTQGLSFKQMCRELETITGKKIQRRREMKISLIGLGMGKKKTLTKEAEEALRSANYVFGAKRLLSMVRSGQITYPYYLAKDILPVLEKCLGEVEESARETEAVKAAVLFSGDSGFYSGCEKMYRALCSWREKLDRENVKVEISICPGISSLSYFAAACGESWQDARILSLHGRSQEDSWKSEVLESVRNTGKTFLLLSGLEDIKKIGRLLQEGGLEHCKVLAGYQLSYEEEEILKLTPRECGCLEREGLYVCLIKNDMPQKKRLTHGKKDSEFLRDKVPMTKEEVREAAICKLQLCEGAVVYDIGSGTGSIAVEIAERSGSVKVFAIEQKEAAVELIRKNREKFHLENMEVIQAKAPEGLGSLPMATHAFIGGSSGNLHAILDALYEKNPVMRVVITAISLETISEMNNVLKSFPVEDDEMIQMQVSRGKKAGAYHLMQAENPVYICSFQFKEKE